jgi:hypothetical protein
MDALQAAILIMEQERDAAQALAGQSDQARLAAEQTAAQALANLATAQTRHWLQ